MVFGYEGVRGAEVESWWLVGARCIPRKNRIAINNYIIGTIEIQGKYTYNLTTPLSLPAPDPSPVSSNAVEVTSPPSSNGLISLIRVRQRGSQNSTKPVVPPRAVRLWGLAIAMVFGLKSRWCRVYHMKIISMYCIAGKTAVCYKT